MFNPNLPVQPFWEKDDFLQLVQLRSHHPDWFQQIQTEIETKEIENLEDYRDDLIKYKKKFKKQQGREREKLEEEVEKDENKNIIYENKNIDESQQYGSDAPTDESANQQNDNPDNQIPNENEEEDKNIQQSEQNQDDSNSDDRTET